jgi:deoxycytidylate deaminase
MTCLFEKALREREAQNVVTSIPVVVTCDCQICTKEIINSAAAIMSVVLKEAPQLTLSPVNIYRASMEVANAFKSGIVKFGEEDEVEAAMQAVARDEKAMKQREQKAEEKEAKQTSNSKIIPFPSVKVPGPKDVN